MRGPLDREKPHAVGWQPTRAGSTGLSTGLLFAPLNNDPRAFFEQLEHRSHLARRDHAKLR
jgi:hypothetical protein